MFVERRDSSPALFSWLSFLPAGNTGTDPIAAIAVAQITVGEIWHCTILHIVATHPSLLLSKQLRVLRDYKHPPHQKSFILLSVKNLSHFFRFRILGLWSI